MRYIFSNFFSKLGCFEGLCLKIMNFARRFNEAAMGGAEGAQRPVLLVWVRAVHGRACEAKTTSHEILILK
jgi:hypothetical protein